MSCTSCASKHWGLFLLLTEAPRPPGLVSTQLFLWSGRWSLPVTCFFPVTQTDPCVSRSCPLAVNTPMWGPCVGIQAKMTDCQKTQYTFLGGGGNFGSQSYLHTHACPHGILVKVEDQGRAGHREARCGSSDQAASGLPENGPTEYIHCSEAFRTNSDQKAHWADIQHWHLGVTRLGKHRPKAEDQTIFPMGCPLYVNPASRWPGS